MPTRLKVFRPQLPGADRLLPYLRRIDATRVYSNWGPLSAELELRLAQMFGVGADNVVSASSGTQALIGSILGTVGRATAARPFAVVPGLTFVAAALAAEQCGFNPFVVDVRADHWSLDLDALAKHPARDRWGLVVVTSPFGKPVPAADVDRFRTRTGIPVVVDGGASFESLAESPATFVGSAPVALSFHATKSFSTAEGGCVVSTDAGAVRRIARALNFGFRGRRNTASVSTNGKMSEYHAAIGLAELDGWPGKRHALRAVAEEYRRSLRRAGVERCFIGAPDIASCYALFDADSGSAARAVRHRLLRDGIESRLWYGRGLLRHRYFRDLSHDALPVTDALGARLVGFPVACDLRGSDIDRVVSHLPTIHE